MADVPVIVFPDIEAVAISYLSGVLDEAVTVDSEWPEHLVESLPVVAVSRGGGATRLATVTDEPTLDIDVLAATKAEAHDLAQLVRAHLFAAQGRTLPGAQIYGVDDTSFIWLPDELTGTPRYVLVLSLIVRPA